MRVAFIGGTNFVGPVAVPMLARAGHQVAVAHRGLHEHDALVELTHFHGTREELLAPGGAIESWQPSALIDTFAGGATAEKASALTSCAERAGAQHVVVISSMDVYQHCVDAGLADGSGTRALARHPVPLTESAPLRIGPYPGGGPDHDNVAMEAALTQMPRATSLRAGAIYGPHASTREWFFVERIARGETTLPLPDGGGQLWHRVDVERVGDAIVVALDRAPVGFWPCNVVDPYDWDYSGLAGQVAQILDWEWEPVRVEFDQLDHPWQTAHPVLASDARLRDVLGVGGRKPEAALEETVRWLWDHRAELLATSAT